jgi:ankyrin repeat protein
MTALLLACWNGREEIVDLLLSYGADLLAISEDRWTALHFAIDKEHLDVVTRLLRESDLPLNATDWVILL